MTEPLRGHFKQVDVLPMVKHYMASIDVYNVLDKYVPTSAKCLAKHAQSLCLLIENIICCSKPLYKVEEWISRYCDGFVPNPRQAAVFNDDRLARSLSALFQADRHSLMTELSLNAIKAHEIMTDEIHNDSTSITLIGAYETNDPDAVKPKHGFNKDHRPDCKQIVFGLNIAADGNVPLSYNLFDGNTDDDVTHTAHWSAIRSLLDREDFIYVADCKLCSKDNLAHIHKNKGYFITLVPRDRKEVKDFYARVRAKQVPWEKAFEVEDSRKKGQFVEYKTCEEKRTKEGYRIIWVHSSGKEKDDRARREKKIEQASHGLEELSGKLNRYHLKTKREIKAAVAKVCGDLKDLIDVKILTDRTQVKVKLSPGRPGLYTKYANKWEFRHRLEWAVNEQAVESAAKIDGIFPLITNTSLEAADVLAAYKRQPFIEKRIYTKKSILEIAPVYLKKPHRIEAIMFLYFVALMIITLMERSIRAKMAEEKIEKLPILPQGMNTRKPTWDNIRYFFRNVHLCEIVKGAESMQIEVMGVTALHAEIARLLGVPGSAYDYLRRDWWLWTGHIRS
jgi:transposase